jgi:hypothetical protein
VDWWWGDSYPSSVVVCEERGRSSAPRFPEVSESRGPDDPARGSPIRRESRPTRAARAPVGVWAPPQRWRRGASGVGKYARAGGWQTRVHVDLDRTPPGDAAPRSKSGGRPRGGRLPMRADSCPAVAPLSSSPVVTQVPNGSAWRLRRAELTPRNKSSRPHLAPAGMWTARFSLGLCLTEETLGCGLTVRARPPWA